MSFDLIGIKGLHIARHGGEHDPFARMVVTVTLAGGQEVQVLDAFLDAPFSYHISAEGIAAAVRRRKSPAAGRGEDHTHA